MGNLATEFFIARRLSTSKFKGGSARVMTPVAILSVAVSVAVVLISGAIIAGFRGEIARKITSLTGDVTVTPSSLATYRGDHGMIYNRAFVDRTEAMEGVARVEPMVTTVAILQTVEGVQGVAVRGMSGENDLRFLESVLVRGALPDFAEGGSSLRQVVLSDYVARALGLEVGQVTELIFVGEQGRKAKFKVAGVYDTGMTEFDKHLAFMGADALRRVAGLDSAAVDGYQVYLSDRTPEAADRVAAELTDMSAMTQGRTARDNYAQIFDWLAMLDLNALIVTLIMLLVAAINMICALLVIVLESRQMVGVLMSQGMGRWSLQRMFVLRSGYIACWGIVWGSVLAVAVCVAQRMWGVVRLDAEAYMLSVVPVDLSWSYVLMVDVGAFVILTVLMLLPTFVLTRISPDSSLRAK